MATVKTCDVQQAQVRQELDRTIKSVDPVRADSLSRLQRVRSAKTKNQEREKLRLTEKLGDEHPRVIALQAKIDTNYKVARNLDLESVRARTEVPQVERDDWLVYGRVLNEQHQAVAGMKVALYDQSGCPIETCGSKITDKNGYFNLTIKNVVNDGGATNGRDKETVDDAGVTATRIRNMEGFLYVLDRNDVTVHRDKRPLTIAAGQTQYLEVVLDDADIDVPTQPKIRYLGDSGSRVLHDLKNQKRGCQIDEIRADHRVNFKTQKEALALKYDYCAYCFDKDISRR